MMNFLVWNSRGVGGRAFVHTLKELKKKFELHFIAILEPRQNGERARKIANRVGFCNWDVVEVDGFRGGIWCFWGNDTSFKVCSKHSQVLHGIVNEGKQNEWVLSVVYGSPDHNRRRALWTELSSFASNITKGWCVCGDFNATLKDDERISVASRPSRADKWFQNWVQQQDMNELDFNGPKHTWSRGRSYSRLDRAVVNSKWLDQFQNASLTHLPKLQSDHTPLLIRLCGVPGRPSTASRFRFFAPWVTHDDFSELVRNSWIPSRKWEENVNTFVSNVQCWNKKVFGNIDKRKRDLFCKMENINREIAYNGPDPILEKQRDNLWSDLEEILVQEEVMWLQRSRCKWYWEGDKNTRFFHASTHVRKRRNNIEALKAENGEWIYDHGRMVNLVERFYSNLYQEENMNHVQLHFDVGYPVIEERSRLRIGRDIEAYEVKEAVFAMGPLKAPGPDGLNPLFFQSQWNIIGNSVINLVQHLFTHPEDLLSVNGTNIVLIPKGDHPETVRDFRPISLCNVIYKILTKIFATRLKRVMPQIISPNQCSFVPGRLGVDNIVLTQEIIHSMRTRKGLKGFMALKIDLEKAYDRVKWSFLLSCLRELQIPEHVVLLIHNCLQSSSMNIRFNGVEGKEFQPSRGIRQGDPISPYLFVIMMEKLAHLIQGEVDNGVWLPFCLKKKGTKVSHLFFADDLILFSEASMDQAAVIKACLEDFCIASGQRVNFDKSRVFFSSNVNHTRITQISSFLGISPTPNLGKYLGVPLHHQRVSASNYNYILEKMDGRLQNWKSRLLSFAARQTLVSSVLSSLPVYSMQSSPLPASTCKDIDLRCRRFLWGEQEGLKKIHLVSWDTVCSSKREGGLGLRQAKHQNDAFMMKLAWGLISKRDDLWVRFLREKYLCGSDLMPHINMKKPGSQVWLGIKRVWNNVRDSTRWKLGNGSSIRFWKDHWLPGMDKLLDLVVMEVPTSLLDMNIISFISASGTWIADMFAPYLPVWATKCIKQVRLETNRPDVPSWRLTSSGMFTTRSAYQYVKGTITSSANQTWCRLWKLKVPQKCKTFIWICLHDRLLTNVSRMHRGLSDSDICPQCGEHPETELHVLRDCACAKSVWEVFVPRHLFRQFFSCRFMVSWVHTNLRFTFERQEIEWQTWYVLICRELWVARNNLVFQKKQVYHKEIIARVHATAKWAKGSGVIQATIPRGEEVWRPPCAGYVKVNVDGAFSISGGSCGGLIRNDCGEVLGGFMFKGHMSNCFEAESWGFLIGLRYAWDNGHRFVVIESDCQDLVGIIGSCDAEDLMGSSVLQEIGELLQREWVVHVDWCPREANSIADAIANKASSLVSGLVCFTQAPAFISDLVRKDIVSFGSFSL